MQKRALGSTGLEVAPLAFGGNVFGWSLNEATSFTLLDAFVAAGFNLIDTADMYSRWVPGNQGGESETIIGKWLKQSGKRDKVIIATKVGMDMGEGKSGLSKDYILKAAEASLKRLGVETIDLYQSHKDDETVPLEETLSAYATLIQQGKVRAIGASNYSARRLSEALEVSRKNGLPAYQTLQPHYNLYDRSEYETALEPVCLRENLGVITYFSLASGFLTGKYRSEKDLGKSAARGQGMKKYLNERGLRIVEALDKLAVQHHASAASIALAWLMARKSVTAPIASATTLKQLDELLASTAITLSADDIALLDQASVYDGTQHAAA